MQTHFIEVTNKQQNWGKFLIIRLDHEWEYPSAFTGNSLLGEVGWRKDNIIVFDLQTGEGARFVPSGIPKFDLEKHKIWVCPMYEPFLVWLYQQDLSDFSKLPTSLNLPDAPFSLTGYRRKGK